MTTLLCKHANTAKSKRDSEVAGSTDVRNVRKKEGSERGRDSLKCQPTHPSDKGKHHTTTRVRLPRNPVAGMIGMTGSSNGHNLRGP